MGFELCYLPDMPAVLRTLAGAEDSIERWWQQLEAAKKHREGSGKVINALAMAASYDPDPTQFLGIPNRYEEFSDNHTGVDYRMDESLPFIAQALSG